MTDLKVVSKSTVELVDFMGSDETIVRSARVSFNRDTDGSSPAERQGLINFMMRNRHMSPFEHCHVTFLIETPIFVAREHMRHRTQSFNELSGRYAQIEPKVYIPNVARPCVQQGKAGDYSFTVDEDLMETARTFIYSAAEQGYDNYRHLLHYGVAKEVARMCLPQNMITRYYASANLRNWLQFLALRNEAQALHEIREVAEQIEQHLDIRFPMVMDAWRSYK